ncbi:MAG: N-acetyl-gamma-glutamyl-phosphate reductase [Treponema sp.]|nr:N-acetyl-gamma-glutamyl-phosphate reductase [Treponema sp.]
MIAGIIGAAGYAGAELVRLLTAHPKITGFVLASVSKPGETITSIYPNFLGAGKAECNPALAKFGDTGSILTTPEACVSASDIVFGALPAGTGEGYAALCLKKGISYIDLSADFRFDDHETYSAWYGKPWQHPELHQRGIYGLPEFNRERIKKLAAAGPCIIGNPGCYPTAVSLACYPALCENANTAGNNYIKHGPGQIIADAISGVSGTGREPSRTNHFSECSDSVSAYKVGAHRHTPEINSTIAKMAGRFVPLIFTPHLGPLNRGILATVYIPLEHDPVTSSTRPQSKEIAEKEATARNGYALFYKDEPFVRVLPENAYASTNRVRQSNYCDLSVHLDHTGSVLIVESAIDNMVKGAAGQAVQNMNIICGFDETEGLTALPALF